MASNTLPDLVFLDHRICFSFLSSLLPRTGKRYRYALLQGELKPIWMDSPTFQFFTIPDKRATILVLLHVTWPECIQEQAPNLFKTVATIFSQTPHHIFSTSAGQAIEDLAYWFDSVPCCLHCYSSLKRIWLSKTWPFVVVVVAVGYHCLLAFSNVFDRSWFVTSVVDRSVKPCQTVRRTKAIFDSTFN